MDANTLTELISTLGFPIIMCAGLFWRQIKSDEQHKEEMEKLAEALNNNTIALLKLTERLRGGDPN